VLGRQTRFVLDHEPPHAPLEEIGPGDFVAASGSKTVWRHEGAGLRIHDHAKGTDVVVHDARIRRWTQKYGESRSVSPDGRTLALSGEGVFGPVPLDRSIKDRAAAKAKDTLWSSLIWRQGPSTSRPIATRPRASRSGSPTASTSPSQTTDPFTCLTSSPGKACQCQVSGLGHRTHSWTWPEQTPRPLNERRSRTRCQGRR